MAVFLRATNRSLLRYVNQEKSLMLMARPVTMKVVEAPRKPVEDYDKFNTNLGRPLSPHLTIYKPQLTSMLSITHRGAGMALGGYLSIVGYWMVYTFYIKNEYCVTALLSLYKWNSSFILGHGKVINS
ncbi:Succinate dehydrogenase/Fumarate reductase transmembrane subunit [Popillia japonica]|uniref:Succinate dehydrogenase/Fumarate reductase transmembrane subunit n=1 Tax=Popillia japonica TaxID=7064 RepID=A0AAW1JDG5_POPJA